MTANLGDRLDAGLGIGHDARPIRIRVALRIGKSRDRLGFGYLVSKDVAERTEFGNLQFAIAHGLDLRVVVGGDVHLHLATKLLADHRRDFFVDRYQPRSRVKRLDAVTNHATIWAVARIR